MVLCTCVARTSLQGFSIRLNGFTNNGGICYSSAIYTGPSVDTLTMGVQISAQAIINASIGDSISVWSNSGGIVINTSYLLACSSISIYLIMPS